MKYSKELTDKIVKDYQAGIMVAEIAQSLQVPMRSVIAKLSSMGIYQKRQYLNKRGEVPVKKFEMIENLAELLGVPSDQLESLEKVNKSVLILLQKRLSDPKLG
jgi:Mn-dependent DtxR family transcriptional regulator